METGDIKLFGPLKYRDSRLDLIRSKTPPFIFNERLENIKVNENENNDQNSLIEPKPLKKLDINKYIKLDQRATTLAIDSLFNFNDNFDNRLKTIETITKHNVNNLTWQGIIHSISKIVIFITFASISITMIRLGYNILGIAPIIITQIDQTNALDYGYNIDNFNDMSFIESVIHDPINPIINTILIIIGILLFVSIIKYNHFRTINHSIHYGLIENHFDLTKIYIILSFNYITNVYFKCYLREIILQIPVDCLDATQEYGHVFAFGTNKLWQIRMKEGKCIFRTLSPVRLLVDTTLAQQNVREQVVEFDIKDLKWLEGGKPGGIDNGKLYGNANIKVVRFLRSDREISIK